MPNDKSNGIGNRLAIECIALTIIIVIGGEIFCEIEEKESYHLIGV